MQIAPLFCGSLVDLLILSPKPWLPVLFLLQHMVEDHTCSKGRNKGIWSYCQNWVLWTLEQTHKCQGFLTIHISLELETVWFSILQQKWELSCEGDVFPPLKLLEAQIRSFQCWLPNWLLNIQWWGKETWLLPSCQLYSKGNSDINETIIQINKWLENVINAMKERNWGSIAGWPESGWLLLRQGHLRGKVVQEEGKAYAKTLRWKTDRSIKRPKERLVWLSHSEWGRERYGLRLGEVGRRGSGGRVWDSETVGRMQSSRTLAIFRSECLW